MVKNIGTQDRNIRYAAGAALVLYGLFTQTWLVALIGLIPIGTAYMRSCPAYSLMNIDTSKGDKG